MSAHALMWYGWRSASPIRPMRGKDVMALVNAVDSSGMFNIVCRRCHIPWHALLQTLPPTLAALISIDNWLARKRNKGAMPTQTGGQTTVGFSQECSVFRQNLLKVGCNKVWMAQGSSQHTDPSTPRARSTQPIQLRPACLFELGPLDLGQFDLGQWGLYSI